MKPALLIVVVIMVVVIGAIGIILMPSTPSKPTEIRGKWDSAGYLRLNPDIASRPEYAADPWLHFKNNVMVESKGDLSNRSVAIGDGRTGKFSKSGYLKIHPDVAAAKADAFRHYIDFGHAENRDIVLV